MKRNEIYTLLALGVLGLAIGATAAVVTDDDDEKKGGAWWNGGTVGGYVDHDVREYAGGVRYKAGDQPWSGKLKRHYKAPRNIGALKGITVHHVGVAQTGDGAFKKMTAHIGVSHSGEVYFIHPLETYLLHGNGFNKDNVSIEVAGSYGDPNKEMPEAQKAGLRKAIKFIRAQVAKQGGKITEIWTHRQSSNQRGADPGRAPYQAGVLWAANSLGLYHDPNYTRGSGKPVADSWLAVGDVPFIGAGDDPGPDEIHADAWADEWDEAA